MSLKAALLGEVGFSLVELPSSYFPVIGLASPEG